MQGLRALRRYFDFSGRSGRAEYWQFLGIFTGAVLIAFLLDALIGNVTNPVLAILTGLALAIPGYAVSVRRAHDRGMSGWWLAASGGLAILRLMMLYQAGQLVYGPVSDALISLAHFIEYVVLGLNVYLFYQFVRRGADGINRYGAPDAAETGPSFDQLVERSREFGKSVLASDPLDQIKRLADLRDAGALTEAEFIERKVALLAAFDGVTHPKSVGDR